MLVFSTQLWELLPSNILSCSPPTPPPFPTSKYSICTKIVRLEGGGGGVVLSCVGDHIPQEFNTIYLTRFRTYKTVLPLSNKKLVRQIKHLPQRPFTGKFFR